MAILLGSNQSRTVSFVAVFSAMIAVLDIIPTIPVFYAGVWDSWPFLVAPIVGILLGPYFGALSVAIGSFVGHMIYFRDPTEMLFMLGLSLGAAMAGFVYQRKWKPVLGIYSTLLLGYFIYPVTWGLPLWGIWDVLVGYGLVLIYIFLATRETFSLLSERRKVILLLFVTVIALETDILFRIFLLVPGQTYWFFYGWTPEYLYDLWLVAGFITPAKVVMAAIVSITLGLQILRIIESEGNSFGLNNENSLSS
ncbi:MAG: ECF transporter S component [Candidatus Thorarchaeota archaeon]